MRCHEIPCYTRILAASRPIYQEWLEGLYRIRDEEAVGSNPATPTRQMP
jgi:hypothetical protein